MPAGKFCQGCKDFYYAEGKNIYWCYYFERFFKDRDVKGCMHFNYGFVDEDNLKGMPLITHISKVLEEVK